MTLHLLKAEAWPLSDAVAHWQAEARGFRAQARRKYRASMAQKIDLPGIYADALEALPERTDGTPPLPVRAQCPWTLDHLMTDASLPQPAHGPFSGSRTVWHSAWNCRAATSRFTSLSGRVSPKAARWMMRLSRLRP
jgi:hypothetical protein